MELDQLTSIHINLPTRLWNAVGGMAGYLSTSKTNIVLRALDTYSYLTRVLVEDPEARVVIERGNGTKEYVPFPEWSRATAATGQGR